MEEHDQAIKAPLYGYKVLRFKQGEFFSPIVLARNIPIGEWLDAECLVGHSVSCSLCRFSSWSIFLCEEFCDCYIKNNHTCGFHAMKSIPELIDWFLVTGCIFIDRSSDYIISKVELAGKVILGTQGFVASKQRLLPFEDNIALAWERGSLAFDKLIYVNSF